MNNIEWISSQWWSESIDTQNLSVEKLEGESGESPPFPKYHNLGCGQPNRPLQISRINSRKCEKLTSTGFSGARTRQKNLSPEVVEEVVFFASFVFLLIGRDGKLK